MTTQELEELKDAVISSIKAESVNVESLQVAESLDGLTSLPALSGNTMVLVPLQMLNKLSSDAAILANKMATSARKASQSANLAAEAANEAATNANNAANAIVYISRSDYESLNTKDENKYYFVYDDTK